MSDWLKTKAHLEPFSGTQEEFNALLEAAKADNHGVINPTDVIWKEGERVGFFSVGSLPLVMAWLHTRKLSAQESFRLINTIEAVIYRSGARGLYIPVPKDSPMAPFMEKFGYTNGGNYDFYFKGF